MDSFNSLLDQNCLWVPHSKSRALEEEVRPPHVRVEMPTPSPMRRRGDRVGGAGEGEENFQTAGLDSVVGKSYNHWLFALPGG